jgi:hypothetical protein
VLALVSSILAACGGQSGGSIPAQPQIQTPQSVYQPDSAGTAVQSALTLTPAERYHWTPFYYQPRPTNIGSAQVDLAGNLTNTIPNFTRKVTSPLDGHTYTVHTVGANFATSTTTTNVTYVPIVVKFKFNSGTVVLDPTKPGCNDTVSV